VVGEIVDKWFVQNTFTSSEFADLRKLVESKERQNLRISVGLPTLNEEATIRRVIRAIRSRLMDRIPLVDEIAVIDSDSDDQTRDIAREEGVPVHVLGDLLPEYGARRGKGEALWKSLHVLTGDIVAWIDTDVTSAHPKFVYGLLGPLLAVDEAMEELGACLARLAPGAPLAKLVSGVIRRTAEFQPSDDVAVVAMRRLDTDPR